MRIARHVFNLCDGLGGYYNEMCYYSLLSLVNGEFIEEILPGVVCDREIHSLLIALDLC